MKNMGKNDANTKASAQHQGTLGTFAGVFTPSILTILGIILFLRLGYVVGSAGLGRCLLILALANGISILTTLSLSAISTNIKVKGGGDYYLISRTLGLEFGGAIGMVLFLAQSISVGFYCIGFGEAAARIVQPDAAGTLMPQLIAAGAAAVLFIFAWLGADWATRFQYGVMAIMCAALVSFFAGGILAWDTQLLTRNWTAGAPQTGFWVIFAIFFPAVTGFTQGVSMSGDLKNPGRSLPLGTFMAVGISIVIYFAAAMVLAGSLPPETLIGDYSAMQSVALFGPLVTAGVVAATLSSAMASFLGAPRIIQSLASDRIFPFLLPFARGEGEGNNPRRAVLLAAAIAGLTIGLGNLNLIAPVVSMFFLISYGLLNYATYFEDRADSPFFRPAFRWYNGRLSLIGALACLGVMLAIDIRAGIVAVAVLFAIYQYLRRTAGPARWADGKRSYHLKQVRDHLLAAAAEPEHPRDWRPQVLLFTGNPRKRRALIQLAGWISGGSGLITLVQVVEAQGARAVFERRQAEQALKKEMPAEGVDVFPLVVSAADFDQGIDMLVQALGIGPLKANIILFGWPAETLPVTPYIHRVLYHNRLKTVFRHGRNILVLDAKEHHWQALQKLPEDERRIDVWWQDDATGRLMLLLAHLIRKDRQWNEGTLRILKAEDRDSEAQTADEFQNFLDEVRIEAEALALDRLDAETVIARSQNASLVFLPFKLQGGRLVDPFGAPVEAILRKLPSTVLVLAAEDLDLEAEPEEGAAAEMATRLDVLADARERVQKARKAADKSARLFKAALEKLADAEASPVSEETLKQIRNAAFEAEEAAEKTSRRLARAEAKRKAAAVEAAAAGVPAPSVSTEEAEDV